ncbi:MAG: hypothetical protein ACE5FU_12790 [Nitrospinota bacterium]
MKKQKEKHFSRLIGFLLIVTSVLVFTSSLKERMRRVTPEPQGEAGAPGIRITADTKRKLLYLWGVEKSAILKADVPMTYTYKEGFFIISIDKIEEPYLLEVHKGSKELIRFSYRPGESYPIFPY